MADNAAEVLEKINPAINIANKTLEGKEKYYRFINLKDEMKGIVEDIEYDEDKLFGKREPKAFFEPEKEFEPQKNKVVKVSAVIAALNLQAAHFMFRTWPDVLLAKLREQLIGKIASVAGAAIAVSITKEITGKAISGTIGSIVGAFVTKGVQVGEMKSLETEIRAGCKKVRKSFNAEALAQVKKPSRVGPTYTRHAV